MRCQYSALCLGFCFFLAVSLFISVGCSPEYHKDDADKEVYKIIDSKWDNNFGQKVNYIVSDAEPGPNDIQPEKIIPSSGILNLAQAVALATAQNRDYQTQKEQLYLSALGLTGTRHKYARRWFATIDGTYLQENEDEDFSIDAGGGFDQTQFLGDTALISTGLAVDWVRFLTGDPRTTLGSVLSASVTVPLLGTGAGKLAREELTQNERNVLYKIRSFNRFRKTFVVSIVSNYYQVLQRKNEVTNAWNNFERVKETQKRLEAEAKVGRKPRFEVDQAEQNVLSARDGYVRTEQLYKQSLDEFKIKLALPTDVQIELDSNELDALKTIGISQPDYTLHAAIETALLTRLDLATSMDRIDDSLRNALLAADGLGAELNLVASAEGGSAGKTRFSRLQFQKGDYLAGFEADLPLDRKLERNAYRQALIELDQQQRAYENDIDIVKLNVREAYRQLQRAAESYRIQEISLDLASKRVESTEILLRTGRARTRDLLEAQDDLLEAENRVAAAMVDHTIAKLSFFRDVGILQVRPDGMWERQERLSKK